MWWLWDYMGSHYEDKRHPSKQNTKKWYKKSSPVTPVLNKWMVPNSKGKLIDIFWSLCTIVTSSKSIMSLCTIVTSSKSIIWYCVPLWHLKESCHCAPLWHHLKVSYHRSLCTIVTSKSIIWHCAPLWLHLKESYHLTLCTIVTSKRIIIWHCTPLWHHLKVYHLSLCTIVKTGDKSCGTPRENWW